MTIEDIIYKKSGRIFLSDEISIIQEITKEKYNTSRCKISQAICERLNWCSENGKPKEWVCRELLIQLEKDGLIRLPPPQLRSFNRFRKKRDQLHFSPPQKTYEGNLGIYSKPELRRVRFSEENTLWEHLVSKYHYLGYKGVMGRFLKYIAYIGNEPVACLGWSGAALKVKARDSWIGWSDDLRRSNLKHIVNNFRFVIFPWARIKFLASHLLSANVPVLVKDWKEQYNVKVYLLETFIDKSRFIGTSYKASNWTCAGETMGYGKRKHGYVKHGLKKDVFLYPIDLNNLLMDQGGG